MIRNGASAERGTLTGFGERAPLAFRGEPDEPVRLYPWPDSLPDSVPGGIIGDIINCIAPNVEPNREAILFHLLVMVGAAIGRGPHYTVSLARHGCNLFCLVVGTTGSAKGMSATEANEVMSRAEPAWKRIRLQGIASGEGIVHAVRDPAVDDGAKSAETKRRGARDPGVSDKRLMIVESEFARVLAVMERKGSTVSGTLRDAWDGGDLQTSSKGAPERATDPHIALIGHITGDELQRRGNLGDISNGLLNRMLICGTQMVRLVATPGTEYVAALEPMISRLGNQLNAARQVGEVHRGPAAEALWQEIYPSLRRRAEPGLMGALLQRAAPQVMRMALILAVTDGSRLIERRHLEAALALWSYSEQSAGYVFGHLIEDPNATKLLEAVRASANGLTRTEITADVFHGHVNSKSILGFLRTLEEKRLIERIVESTDGRSRERWKVLNFSSHTSLSSPSGVAKGLFPEKIPTRERREESEESRREMEIERRAIMSEGAEPATRSDQGSEALP